MGKQGEFVSLDPAFHFLLSVQYVSWFLCFQMALCEPAVSCGVSSSYVVPSSWFYSFDIVILSGFFSTIDMVIVISFTLFFFQCPVLYSHLL